jgi:hypothetical protein
MYNYMILSRKYNGPKGKRTAIRYSLLFLILAVFFCSVSSVYSSEDALDIMKDDVVSYFNPVKGSIISVQGKKAIVDIGAKDAVRPGMRFTVLREEAPFRHPVTKELLGTMESFIGRLDIEEVSADSASGEIIEGNPAEGDKIRISEVKVNMMFCQAEGVDWHLAEAYYRKLKDTGRFQMIDTSLETDDPDAVLKEARRLEADVVLNLNAGKAEEGLFLIQSLYWVSDGLKFAEMQRNAEAVLARETKFAEKFFTPPSRDAVIKFQMPVGADLMTTGDLDGDGKPEIIFSARNDIIAYTVEFDLLPALGGIRIKGSARDEHLWLDAADLNRNGRDEVVITTIRGDSVVSCIYEYSGKEFVLLYKTDGFMRTINEELFIQSYSRKNGFEGPIFPVHWDGDYKRGEALKLPADVNIYDFILFEDTQAGRLLLAYDEAGFLNVYDAGNRRLWRSKRSAGDFLRTFRKDAPSKLTKSDSTMIDTTMIDRGKWAVKDRLFLKNREILYIRRIPLLDMMKGIGYKSSQVRSLIWNGLSMEEEVVIDNIGGTILDYALARDKIIVLASPLFGIKPGNILKGESPLKSELYIYSLKGR